MILRVPEIFEDSTNALSKFKYNYRLSREASVLDKKYVEVYANCDKMIRPVTYNLTVGKEKWKLEIMSRAGWSNSTTLYLIFFGGLSLVLLLTGLTIVLFLLDERRVELKKLVNKDGLQSDVRKQLGFVLNDISENLPGAFMIYRADKEDDEIFYANKEFLDMAGYENLDELFKSTKKSFRNLIHEDQREAVEVSIWN
ncbi:PAS domain-containing protein [Holdemanella porci]|uniref:PAS domain-containing protein n=1 Tax=Holdemanella porci TaxID=2652276 RepID=UPI0022E0D3C0|nr:PAS domain-containing protein [Holdemanella porci]